jgi:hypothetical protein
MHLRTSKIQKAMTEAERVAVMRKVATGELTIDQALAIVAEKGANCVSCFGDFDSAVRPRRCLWPQPSKMVIDTTQKNHNKYHLS